MKKLTDGRQTDGWTDDRCCTWVSDAIRSAGLWPGELLMYRYM